MKIKYSVLTYLTAMMISGAHAGSVSVTTNADSGPGSLRDVLMTVANDDVIDFAPALNGATITLISGALDITGLTLTLDASALPSGITLSGNHNSRILTIKKDESTNVIADVTLKNLHLRYGRAVNGNGGGVSAFQCHLVLDGGSIQDCFSDSDGGGLWGNGVTGSIQRCKIAGNQSGANGGGIFLIGINGTKSLDISSSQISGNVAPFGGGIYNLLANPTLWNCSIQGNSGSGMRSESSSNPVLRNCIVWGNTMSGGTAAASQLNNESDSRPNVANCLIEGAAGAAGFMDGELVVWGSGNLDGTAADNEPGFVGAVSAASAPNSAADLRFFTGSRCWNAGNNAFGGTSQDLAGNARVQDGTIDLGAYEGGYVS
ncbi:MAG: right-handed parallel beta-helix repeat-containing protein, partial [Verrucomicrobiota bacterium]